MERVQRVELMLEYLKNAEAAKDQEPSFIDYTSRELVAGLKNFLGRADSLGVCYFFVDTKTLAVRFEGQWIWIDYAQIKPHLPTKKPGP